MRHYQLYLAGIAFLFAISLLASGCLSHPRVETVLHESSRGAVFLIEFPDPSFQANHPLSLDPNLVRRVLAGVHVQEQKTLIESFLTEEAKSVPVFTSAEVSFLAPLLRSALSRATPGEQVGFRSKRSEEGKSMDTEGALYATDSNLHISISQYGRRPQRPATLSRPTRSFDRAKRWFLTFSPEAALVNWKEETQVSVDGSQPNTLVIRPNLLERYAESQKGAASGHEGTDGPPSHEPKKTRASGAGQQEQPTEAVEREVRQLRDMLEIQEEKLEQLQKQLEQR